MCHKVHLFGTHQSFLGDGVPVQPRGEEGGEGAEDGSTNDISCVSSVG